MLLDSKPTQPQPRWHYHLSLSPPSHGSRVLEEPSCSRTDRHHTACFTSALCNCALVWAACATSCAVERRAEQRGHNFGIRVYVNTPGPPQRVQP
jgi:hypothetical protein